MISLGIISTVRCDLVLHDSGRYATGRGEFWTVWGCWAVVYYGSFQCYFFQGHVGRMKRGCSVDSAHGPCVWRVCRKGSVQNSTKDSFLNYKPVTIPRQILGVTRLTCFCWNQWEVVACARSPAGCRRWSYRTVWWCTLLSSGTFCKTPRSTTASGYHSDRTDHLTHTHTHSILKLGLGEELFRDLTANKSTELLFGFVLHVIVLVQWFPCLVSCSLFHAIVKRVYV